MLLWFYPLVVLPDLPDFKDGILILICYNDIATYVNHLLYLEVVQ